MPRAWLPCGRSGVALRTQRRRFQQRCAWPLTPPLTLPNLPCPCRWHQGLRHVTYVCVAVAADTLDDAARDGLDLMHPLNNALAAFIGRGYLNTLLHWKQMRARGERCKDPALRQGYVSGSSADSGGAAAAAGQRRHLHMHLHASLTRPRSLRRCT